MIGSGNKTFASDIAIDTTTLRSHGLGNRLCRGTEHFFRFHFIADGSHDMRDQPVADLDPAQCPLVLAIGRHVTTNTPGRTAGR